MIDELAPGLFRVRDTCHVYVVAAPDRGGERTGIAIDFGSGAVLDHLEEMGLDRLTHVLMTHHHRDQAQGLDRAVAAGVAVHVPPVEQDLFARVDRMWERRQVIDDYNLREDRFSLLEPVEVAGLAREYRTTSYGGVDVLALPTPGHTPGSVSYLVDTAAGRVGFTGDLIYAPGKVWSLAATQWSYTETEGSAMTVISCLQLQDHDLDLLCPSHGEPMTEPRSALAALAGSMQRYVDSRRPEPWDLGERLNSPFEELTPHLLRNRSSLSYSYVLISDSGAALVFDFGFDMTTGLPAGSDRAARRPWLASLPALKRDHGVTHVEVAIPTHYHDDHVAGMPLLRDVEGTQIWTPAHIAPVLATPLHHDVPCQWFDPIPSDVVLEVGGTVRWREYSITVHDLPGHTLFAAAYEVEVDGVRVLVTGDQQDGSWVPGERAETLNYQYRNRFQVEDFRKSAALYSRLRPDLMVSGHWKPRWVDDDYLAMLTRRGEDVVDLHRALLPDELDLGADSILCRLTPYYSMVAAGEAFTLTAQVRNPFDHDVWAEIRPVTPYGWDHSGPVRRHLPAGGTEDVEVTIVAEGAPRRRLRVAVDVRIGDLRLGQHAEALLDVVVAKEAGG
jgi:glyoxylase-like metal-dependent hydrolase (beta-lactamase superfamily II)